MSTTHAPKTSTATRYATDGQTLGVARQQVESEPEANGLVEVHVHDKVTKRNAIDLLRRIVRELEDEVGPSFDQWVESKRTRFMDGDYPMRLLTQYDIWCNYPGGDDVMRPDEDGDVFMWGMTHEPQVSDTTVRAHVDPHADPADAVRVLRKIADHIEHVGACRIVDTGEPPF